MIFVTVGGQMPFDRLIQTVDAWARESGRRDVFAQVGVGGCRPHHLDWAELLAPPDYYRRVAECDVMIAHAGMGSIIAGLEARKPLLVLPRRGKFAETRNDHQVDTARHFCTRNGVTVAQDEHELRQRLDQLATLPVPATAPSPPDAALLETVSSFVWATRPRPRRPSARA